MEPISELPAGIACFIHRAEKLQIRDKLVAVVLGEMGCASIDCNGKGKDQWSTGSIRFLGPGITGHRARPEHIRTKRREIAGTADDPRSKKFPFVVTAEDKLQGLWD